MKIAVVNGSPKGKNSITLQTVRYLKIHFSSDEFEVIHVGQRIKSLEKPEKLDECMDILLKSDLILFAYPVYTFIVPYQLHRFIELVLPQNFLGVGG